jgi:hypothetical protein
VNSRIQASRTQDEYGSTKVAFEFTALFQNDSVAEFLNHFCLSKRKREINCYYKSKQLTAGKHITTTQEAEILSNIKFLHRHSY